MQFDGVERYRQMRKERSLGALRREGFQPARRHPSASRRRVKEAPEFGSDDAFLGGCEERPQDSGDLALRVFHNIPCTTAQLGAQHRGNCGRISPTRRCIDVAPDGDAVRSYQRSLSAPPIRSMQPRTRMSCDLKMTRASNVAMSLSKMGEAESIDPLQRPEVKELYGWLKAISLHEYLPSLLEMGVEEVNSHQPWHLLIHLLSYLSSSSRRNVRRQS